MGHTELEGDEKCLQSFGKNHEGQRLFRFGECIVRRIVTPNSG